MTLYFEITDTYVLPLKIVPPMLLFSETISFDNSPIWEGPGGSRRVREGWEDLRRSRRDQDGLEVWESLGGSRRVWKDPGGSGRVREGPGVSGRVWEGPGVSKWIQEGP